MKEIDFLPEWYKSGIRRQVNYRVQYIILSGFFVVMMVWNLVTAGSISSVRAKYMQMGKIQLQSKTASLKLEQCKSEIAVLHEKEKVLNSIDSNINLSNVLAELSFIVSERIVLDKVELISELIPDTQSNVQNSQSLSVVKSTVLGNSTGTLLGNVCFKVLIDGVAANGSDVAALLCDLEDSPYFNRVNLLYSKDSEVKPEKKRQISPQMDVDDGLINNQNVNIKSSEPVKVSEFEITCYLSNYIQPE